jgi:antitoxin ParD1/3/4
LTFLVILAVEVFAMNVSLTPELEKFVDDTVATGRYSSASEVVRASLRNFEETERWNGYIREKIQQGLDDIAAGRVVDGETAMKRIRGAIRKKA